MFDGQIGRIEEIDYDNIDKTRMNGSPMPIYRVSFKGGYSYFGAEHLKLVSSGPTWNIAHGLDAGFVDLRQEASFALRTGAYEAVKKANSRQMWTDETIKDAVETGEADAIRGCFPFEGGNVYPIRFDDRELGERVRRLVIDGLDYEDKRDAHEASPSP